MFLKLTKSGGRQYAQVAESFRNEDGQPRQRTICTLGRLEPDGDVDKLIGALQRARGLEVASACNPLDGLRFEGSRCAGDVWALWQLWRSLGFDDLARVCLARGRTSGSDPLGVRVIDLHHAVQFHAPVAQFNNRPKLQDCHVAVCRKRQLVAESGFTPSSALRTSSATVRSWEGRSRRRATGVDPSATSAPLNLSIRSGRSDPRAGSRAGHAHGSVRRGSTGYARGDHLRASRGRAGCGSTDCGNAMPREGGQDSAARDDAGRANVQMRRCANAPCAYSRPAAARLKSCIRFVASARRPP